MDYFLKKAIIVGFAAIDDGVSARVFSRISVSRESIVLFSTRCLASWIFDNCTVIRGMILDDHLSSNQRSPYVPV